MNFTPELTALQGALLSADNVHSFSRLTEKGGNEAEIEYVITTIQAFLHEKQYVAKNKTTTVVETLNKFALYIILNADLPSLQEMVEMQSIDLVVWTVPTISKCLMCEMLWKFGMDNSIFQIICYCYPPLALDVAVAFVDHLKYCAPVDCLNKLKLLASASYKFICRLNFFTYDETKLKRILNDMYTNFQKCVNYFAEPPNSYKLGNLNTDQQYAHAGNIVYTMLLLIIDCFRWYGTTDVVHPFDCAELYAATLKMEDIRMKNLSVPTCSSTVQPILECVDKCNILLLDIFQKVVMTVTLDMYCAWSEFVENGKNMQETIGKHCYQLQGVLKNCDKLSEHPVVAMMDQIIHKPLKTEEVIHSLGTEEVIKNINKNDEDKESWVKAILSVDRLHTDIKLMNILLDNVKLLSSSEIHQAIFSIYKHIKESSNKKEKVDVIVKLFSHCDVDQKHKILSEVFENGFNDLLESEEFDNMMTEIFNKLATSSASEITNVMNVFLQNPRKVLTKILILATENAQQSEIMLNVIKLFENYNCHCYGSDTLPCLIYAIQAALDQELTEARQHCLVKFIQAMKTNKIIVGSRLLLLVVMPNLERLLKSKDVARIGVQNKILFMAFRIEELLQYRAPILIMLEQMMRVVRWKIHTFIECAPLILQQIQQLQILLIESYNNEIPESDAKWLRHKLKNIDPLNLYYYRKLWNPPGKTFVGVISGMHIHRNMDLEKLITWLSQVLCSCTPHEWVSVYDSLATFGEDMTLDILHDALSFITAAEAENRTPSTWSCVFYCYKNFVYIIRYKFFKEPLSDAQIDNAVEKIALTANFVEEEHCEEISTLFLPLISYMVQNKSNTARDVNKNLQSKLINHKFAELVDKVFHNVEAASGS